MGATALASDDNRVLCSVWWCRSSTCIDSQNSKGPCFPLLIMSAPGDCFGPCSVWIFSGVLRTYLLHYVTLENHSIRLQTPLSAFAALREFRSFSIQFRARWPLSWRPKGALQTSTDIETVRVRFYAHVWKATRVYALFLDPRRKNGKSMHYQESQ